MRETGPVRKELIGDDAAPYMGAARTVLGQLKNDMAFNELAQGQRTRRLPDGTVIEVSSRFGQDEVHIFTPTPVPVTIDVETIEQKTSIKPLDENVVEVDSSYPYLWVGARIVSGGADLLGATEWPAEAEEGRFVKLHLCLWEVDNTASDGWTILSNRNIFGIEGDATKYPLRPNKTKPENAPKGLAYTEAHHCVSVDDQLPTWLRDVAQALGTTATHLREATYAPGTDTKYDTVIICDPNDKAKLNPLAGGSNWAKGVPVGQFHVKVMATASDCINYTPVEVEVKIIVGQPGSPGTATKTARFTISEFTKYNFGMLPKGWFPPEGSQSATECFGQNDAGPNPHGPHWFQGGAAILLAPTQIGVPKDSLLKTGLAWKDGPHIPPTGFVAGSFPVRNDRCRVCDVKQYKYEGIFVTWDSYASDGTSWPDFIPPTKPYGYHASVGIGVGFNAVIGGDGQAISTMGNIYPAFGVTSMTQYNDTDNPGWGPPNGDPNDGQPITVEVAINTVAAPLSQQIESFPGLVGGNSVSFFLVSWYWDADGNFRGERVGDFIHGGTNVTQPPEPPPPVPYNVPYPYHNYDGQGNEINPVVRQWRYYPFYRSGFSTPDKVGYGWPDPAEPTKPSP